MALREVEIYGSQILRQKAETVTDFGSDLHELVQDMMDTIVEEEGVGLAATQIAKLKRVILLNLPREDQDSLMIPMINPEISDSGGETEFEEGCLSVPGIREVVKRPEWIQLRYHDLKGEQHNIRADGIMARVVQHELDHLNGILFVDRISTARRMLISGKLKKMSRENSSS
jgi:peptide deformylase